MPALRRIGPVSCTSCVVTAKPLSRMCLTQSSQQPQVGVFQTSTLAGVCAVAKAGAQRAAARATRRVIREMFMRLLIDMRGVAPGQNQNRTPAMTAAWDRLAPASDA